jgi:hypothetical protein
MFYPSATNKLDSTRVPGRGLLYCGVGCCVLDKPDIPSASDVLREKSSFGNSNETLIKVGRTSALTRSRVPMRTTRTTCAPSRSFCARMRSAPPPAQYVGRLSVVSDSTLKGSARILSMRSMDYWYGVGGDYG